MKDIEVFIDLQNMKMEVKNVLLVLCVQLHVQLIVYLLKQKKDLMNDEKRPKEFKIDFRVCILWILC